MRSPRWALYSLLAALGLAGVWARRGAFLEAFEDKTLDWRFRSFSDPARRDPDIVLLMLDQQSLDQLEKDDNFWPWHRSLYSYILDFCKTGGARAVVLDALFTSPSPYGRDDDTTLAQSLAAAPSPVLAMEMGRAEVGRDAPPPERFALSGGLGASAAPKESVRLPFSTLTRAARYLGDASEVPDADGVFRRVSLLSAMSGRVYPTLPAAAVLAVSRAKTASLEGDTLTLGDYRVPLVDGRMLVRFHGSAFSDVSARRTYASYPLGSILRSWENVLEGRPGDPPPSAFKDKIVFVGFSAPGLMDLRPSPVSAVSPGTEIVAAAVDNILQRDFLRKAPTPAAIPLVFLALACGAAAALLAPQPWLAAAAAAAASAALAGAAILAFRRGLWVDMVLPQLSLWLGFAAASAYGYALEGRQRREIKRAFAHYLAPEVVDELAEHPEKLSLGGERRELTCCFSDIENFTTLSESLEPERLAALMNRYLGAMTDTILESKGTLDKYIGDAIMAFWGAPAPLAGHALAACRAAVANQEKLAGLRREFAAEGLPAVKARVGIHTGPASVGNMGSARRFSYTALGDTINLASRLEGANKLYGTYVLISESTRAAAGNAVEARELDVVKVKGKTRPVKIYELLGLRDRVDPARLEKARAFEAALDLYRRRRWEEAGEAFEAVVQRFGPDVACRLYVERCRRLEASAPAEDWDGSFALTEK